jgi:cysteine synthase A
MNGLIGNTPLIKIDYMYKEKLKSIYVKLEYYNLTGSIKDRMAYYILDKSKQGGLLKENMPIIEATSGNTGISFAALGSYYKHPVYIYMPIWASQERIKIMESYGAKVFLVSQEEGGFIECINKADLLSEKLNGFRPNQFSNIDNINVHYEKTSKEIIDQLKDISVGGFISGIGTGGTLMGVGKRLKEVDNSIIIAALEPDKLPILSQGTKYQNHKIEGIGDDFIPDLVDRNFIDKIILINDDDAVNMARCISKYLGIGVGISSGANMLGAVILQEEINKNVVTIFPDDNKKYLSTDLLKEIDLNSNFISNQIKLLNYSVINV